MKKFIMLTVLYGMFYGHANGMIDSEEAQKAEAITDSAMENEKTTEDDTLFYNPRFFHHSSVLNSAGGSFRFGSEVYLK